MNDMLDEICAQVGVENLAVTCNRDGCDVSMSDIPSDRIIVDADLAFPAHSWKGERCDFIVFLCYEDESLRAVPIELKSGEVAIAKAVRQLRKGAKFVDKFGPKEPSPVCRPILIHGRPMSPRNRTRLNRLKVSFRGLNLTIKTARCGVQGNLALALKM